MQGGEYCLDRESSFLSMDSLKTPLLPLACDSACSLPVRSPADTKLSTSLSLHVLTSQRYRALHVSHLTEYQSVRQSCPGRLFSFTDASKKAFGLIFCGFW